MRIRFHLNVAPHLLIQGKTFKCSCTDRAIIDDKGLHFSKCKKGGGVIKRHDVVHHTLHLMLAATGVPAKKEPTSKGFASASQFRNLKGEQLRPDTIELVNNNFYDTMIPDSRNPTYTGPNGTNSANTPGFAANKGETFKINHYKDITDIGIWKFYPLIIESMGKFSEGTLSTVKKWASQIAMRSEVEYGIVKRRWIERISVALQKGNAAIINGKLEKLANYYYNIPGRYDNLDMFISLTCDSKQILLCRIKLEIIYLKCLPLSEEPTIAESSEMWRSTLPKDNTYLKNTVVNFLRSKTATFFLALKV